MPAPRTPGGAAVLTIRLNVAAQAALEIIFYAQFPNKMHKRQNKQKTANKFATESIFSDVSSQGGNAFFLKEKIIKREGGPLLDRPYPQFLRQTMRSVDRFAQVPSTLETLPPTERIEAIAATAISETISVYSMTTAPCVFIIRRRKSDSMITPNLK